MKNLFNVDGQIWIKKQGQNFIGKGRIELLENIEVYGSISKAAKHMKMSYKAAWDSVDIMSKLAQEPLVTRVSGGKGGGGTIITSYAKELIYSFKEIQALNQSYFELLEYSFNEKVDDDYKASPSFTRLSGVISELLLNNENYEVKILLNSKQVLYSINSKDFIREKDLKVGDKINFLIETSSIVLHTSLNTNSSRNILKGKVIKQDDDGINSNITIDCENNDIIHAKITSQSSRNLNITIDKMVYAQFKAYNISII